MTTAKIPGVRQVINVGAAPNDGTGDTLRDSMIYVNENFAELYSNAYVNTNITVGNNSVNTIINSTAISVNVVSSNSRIIVGNSSVNTVANSTNITTNTANIVSNTLTLGTSTVAANGYTYLPNGLKMNWGWVLANSTTAGAVTFSSAFTTNAYIVIATSNTATPTYQAGVVSWNKTGANVVTGNTTSTNVFWTAIGA